MEHPPSGSLLGFPSDPTKSRMYGRIRDPRVQGRTNAPQGEPLLAVATTIEPTDTRHRVIHRPGETWAAPAHRTTPLANCSPAKGAVRPQHHTRPPPSRRRRANTTDIDVSVAAPDCTPIESSRSTHTARQAPRRSRCVRKIGPYRRRSARRPSLWCERKRVPPDGRSVARSTWNVPRTMICQRLCHPDGRAPPNDHVDVSRGT